MAGLLTLTTNLPSRTVMPGEILIAQGETGGDLFVLETGRLSVERDGVVIATLAQPGTLVGELSVLLGITHTATVRAEAESRLKIIRDARGYLEDNPKLLFRVAALVAGRLDATSALLVDLNRQHSGKNEQGLLARIFASLHRPASDETSLPGTLFEKPQDRAG